jgi:hypothetical protein
MKFQPKWKSVLEGSEEIMAYTLTCLLIFSKDLFYLGFIFSSAKTKTKLCGVSPGANYTDRVTAACLRS